MPTINLNIVKRETARKPYNKANNDVYRFVYNTTVWRALRLDYLRLHPVCEYCGKKLATQVHHIVPVSTGETPEEKVKLGFNPKNLMALCEDCHRDIHSENIDEEVYLSIVKKKRDDKCR